VFHPEHAEKDLARVEAGQAKAADALQDLVVKVAAIEASVKALEKNADKGGDRRFSVWMLALSCLLTLAASVGLMYLKAYLDQKH
jgi:hypothetical protein